MYLEIFQRENGGGEGSQDTVIYANTFILFLNIYSSKHVRQEAP